MPKVKALYGLNNMTHITKSPKTNRLNGSQTQPASNRINGQIEVECDRKDCMMVKWNGIQAQHQLQLTIKELDKYKLLYIKERKKIGETYKEIESVMSALTRKEKELKKKEEIILQQELELQTKQQQNETFNQSLKALNKQLTERQNQLSTQENELQKTTANQFKLIDDVSALKANLESSVKYLEQKESQLFNQLQDLQQQEQDTLKRVGNLTSFLQNTGEHFQLLQSIEQLFKEKQTSIDGIKQSIEEKQEELSQIESQLQLRSVCASLNEAAFMKRVAQTERMSQKTPSNHKPFFRNVNSNNILQTNNFNNNYIDHQIFSSVQSRENSPGSYKESFKLIRKAYNPSQVPMTEINNFDMKI